MSDPNPPATPELNRLQPSRFGASAGGCSTLGLLSQNDETPCDIVFYTHTLYDTTTPGGTSGMRFAEDALVCHSLDDLMSYMEQDLVSEIIFDTSVGSQEMDYLSRWAKIFKPSVRCSRPAARENAAFFSGQQN